MHESRAALRRSFGLSLRVLDTEVGGVASALRQAPAAGPLRSTALAHICFSCFWLDLNGAAYTAYGNTVNIEGKSIRKAAPAAAAAKKK
jgi:hypothetical protein